MFAEEHAAGGAGAGESVITAYIREQGRIVGRPLSGGEALPKDVAWVDLLSPSDAERVLVSTAINIDLPTKGDMQAIEVSNRLYAKDKTLYLTTDILVGFETPDPGLGAVMAVLAPSCLVTVRYCEPRAIVIFADRLRSQPNLIATSEDGLLAFLDAVTDRTADVIEMLGQRVDRLSRQAFPRPTLSTTSKDILPRKVRPKTDRLQNILSGIGATGDITHKINLSMGGMIRLMTFLGSQLAPRLNAAQATAFKAVEGDVRALNEQAQVMAHETAFLLDATLGQINVEQNNIIKIFSVVMVAFTPPTFFASMWGMNFHGMPEYAWKWGYPMALGVMVVSAILPLWYFRRRGWM